MLPTLTVWGLTLDLGLALLLVYLSCSGSAAGPWNPWPGPTSIAPSGTRTRVRLRCRLDRYECPQGELLTLDAFDGRNKLALYKAPASTCNECVLKEFCTPHDDGRRVYRSLAEFHESDVGRFHRWLSLIILAVALAFSAGGMIAWWNKPGEWLLVIATGLSLVFLWLDVRDASKGGTTSLAGTGDRGWVR